MRIILILMFFLGILHSSSFELLSKAVVRDLNYIYQNRGYSGGSTYAKETRFKYSFKTISAYEIEIQKSVDGMCADEPFIMDLRQSYWIKLEEDTKCDPALIIYNGKDIIYLRVKDRCGVFGGFNLYKRAQDAVVLLKEHFYELERLK